MVEVDQGEEVAQVMEVGQVVVDLEEFWANNVA